MLCLAGRVEEAYDIRNSMEASGLFPNVATANIMVDRLCKAKKLEEEAHKVFDELSQRGCAPDSVTYCSLIDELGQKGKLDKAYRLF
jgi:pentatricopeptide repeat protein